jgi:hypothetical protein
MRTTGLLAAIGIALTLAAPSALAQGKDAVPAPAQNPDPNPVFNSNSGPRDTDVPTDTPMNSPMNAPSTPPAQQVAPPPPERWNSAAAAIWRVRGQVHVAIGYSGVRSSADEARASAVDACRSAGGSGCKAIGAWNNGCLYITTGRSTNRAGWGSGGDIETALKKCRAYGFTCKQPIGGCVN